MRKAVRTGLVALLALLLLALAAFVRDMDRSYDRVRGRGEVLSLPWGELEYLDGGSGTAVLVIHGAGGGYDQGELVAQAVLDDAFRWIAPSRFGYLRSTLPAGATWDDQAHAYARLLDHLDLDVVAVVALSQGGPSALLFAVLYPERVSSLTCLSCGVASSASAEQAGANRKGRLLKAVFAHDLAYWAASRLFRRQLMGVMGASKDVVASLTPEQRAIVDRLIDWMNPASPRSAGAAFDNEAALPGDRIAAISAPTLIVHALDDTLQLIHNAEFAAAVIPGARLLRYERGGHVVIAVEQEAVGAAVREHILGHAGTPRP